MVKKLIQIFIIALIVVSCDNKTSLDKRKLTYLDSLINFDTITAIYSKSSRPPQIKVDLIIGEEETKSTLYIDSINKWTQSQIILDSIAQIFPRLKQFPNPYWTTTCCGSMTLLIKTKKQEHSIYWLSLDDSLVMFDQVIYKADKKNLNKINSLLDRKIITKEIPTNDSINYILNDVYNTEYLIPCDSGQETMFIYLIK